MIDIEAAERAFQAAINGFHEQEARRQIAALRVIAAHALTVAPQATHMLMESSDQGAYLCTPSFLTVGEEHVAEDEWDAHVEEHDDDLASAPSWLPFDSDGPQSNGWGQFVDADHPHSNRRGGYYAIDLRKLTGADAIDAPPLKADLKAEVLDGDNGGKYARVEVGPNHPIPERLVTTYVDPESGALIVEVDGPMGQAASDGLHVKVYVNDHVVHDSEEQG